MKIALRLSTFLTVLALVGCLTVGPVWAQIPNPQYDSLFAKALTLEGTQPDKAFEEYTRVKDESKDREVQAEALLRAALFASSPRFSNNEELRAQGEQKAHESYKFLQQHLGDTAAAKFAREQGLQTELEKRIDKYNSQYFSYQMVDKLVALTGRFPAFSYWFALFLIAVIVKTLTFPLTLKMYKSQREMQRIQPILKELQEQYKDDKVTLNTKVMEAYKEHGINPLASCFPLIIQLPFLFWVYNTIRLYELHFANGGFFWIGSSLATQYPEYVAANLGQFDLVLLAIYAASNYLTMRLTPASDPQAAQMQKTTAIVMTFMMFYICMTSRWSAAFIFYWLVLNFISTYQQYKYIYLPNKNGSALEVLPAPAKGPAARASTVNAGAGNGPGVHGNTGSAVAKPQTLTPVPNEGIRPRPKRKKR